MLMFHEGLPGSGKSYEAVVKHILPAIKSGRMVYAWVDGLNHAKIAEVLKMDGSIVRELLIQIDRDEVINIPKLVSQNSLVVIDELASFWSVGKKISDSISDFVKEHRHLGIDILAMDQDLRDCHAVWKRRVDQKVQFMKLDMLGKKSSYKWTLYKAKSGENFEKISTGVEQYDAKYFGTYSSHVSEGVNTEIYKDDRSVIWKGKWFRLGLLFVVIMFIFAPWYLFRFFDPKTSPIVHKTSSSISVSTSSPVSSLPVQSSSVTTSKVERVETVEKIQKVEKAVNDDYVGKLGESYRVRLVTVLASYSRPPYVVVEFRDSSYRVQERLDSGMLADLGWGVDVKGLRLVILHKPGQNQLIATAWPIEPFGEVSAQQNEAVRSASPASAPSASRVSNGGI